MKILRTIAIVVLVMMLGMSALAESGSARIDALAHSIEQEIGSGKYPHDMIVSWMDDYTVAEWEKAAVMAVQSYRERELSGDAFYTMGFDWEAYLDGSFFTSAEYLSILAQYGLVCESSTTPVYLGDLGDESVSIYVLCAAAAVALGGAVLANRKRARA